MSKSTWTILALGAMGAACLMMAMCASLQTFTTLPPSANRAGLAENLRGRFGFESAGVLVTVEEGRNIMRISYETQQDSKRDILRQRQEMKEVADHAVAQLEGKERREIDEIRVTRTEVRGSGCWQDRQAARESFPNPARNAVETFNYDK